jgi:hypothetical protein
VHLAFRDLPTKSSVNECAIFVHLQFIIRSLPTRSTTLPISVLEENYNHWQLQPVCACPRLTLTDLLNHVLQEGDDQVTRFVEWVGKGVADWTCSATLTYLGLGLIINLSCEKRRLAGHSPLIILSIRHCQRVTGQMPQDLELMMAACVKLCKVEPWPLQDACPRVAVTEKVICLRGSDAQGRGCGSPVSAPRQVYSAESKTLERDSLGQYVVSHEKSCLVRLPTRTLGLQPLLSSPQPLLCCDGA